jgi:hypothetical protein
LEGENPEHLLSTPTAVLDEIAIGWAAHILSRYPLPNTLRALLSHVSISDTIDPVVLAQTLAALSLDESAWQELLGHHFSTRYHGPNASQQSGRAWVQQLQLLATNNDRAQSQ